MGRPRKDPHGITVTFLEDSRHVKSNESLDFGRDTQLVVDDNPYLHRTVGRFVQRDGVWWLQNLGRRIELTVNGVGSRWSATLPPGTQAALTTERSMVRFSAGAARYELNVECAVPVAPVAPVPAVTLDRTMEPQSVRLGPEHRALLATMASLRLTGADVDRDLPTNQEVADQLGWTLKKVNRKIDWLCVQYSAQGVDGLRGPGARTNERRHRLVDHVVSTGEITVADLKLAGIDPTPRRRARRGTAT